MGTGIVANAAATLPFRIPGLHEFALVVWVLAAAWLTVLAAAWAAGWAKHTNGPGRTRAARRWRSSGARRRWR